MARSVGWLLLVGAVAGAVLLGMSPSPYAVERPGPVYDVLGNTEVNGKSVPLIDIPGHTTYPTTGALDMLTVYVDGTPQNRVSWIELASSWFDVSRAAIPLDELYPAGQTEQQSNVESALDMTNSQQAAIAAALTELKIHYTSQVVVAQVITDTPAAGKLKAGDELVTANGEQVTGLTMLQHTIQDNGVTKPVELAIRRNGTLRTVEITPTINSDSKKPTVGIYTGSTFTFPFDVKIQLQDVGGPSAGMMMALGIYDKLTPGDLVGHAHIAGTGTIDPSGAVGAIGGIRQKMYGARDAGATWFLAPESNCNEVTGHIPSGLTVFAVKTLDDSLADVKVIASGGDTSKLATCSRP
ncbi:MAG TPA: PDZ domain-containing protein [Pseudolysinimonas sp.]|nr:PDZ domain-containing protein [Pseudolysinimonas sp.]